jgi:nucleoside-diphosphate-sugar epimerase
MASRIAITGHTGFIGQHLLELLVRRGNIVYPIGRDFKSVECDIVYHLACPSTTEYISNHTREVMDTILDGTRKALNICPKAFFVNASSIGAKYIVDNTPQSAYNVAKRCMEIYLEYSAGPTNYINYNIPSVYGPGAHSDSFIQRCVDGTAYAPTDPDKVHYIAHVNDVVQALADCKQIPIEEITLGQIYEQFNSGRRGIHRATLNPQTTRDTTS